ncbi:hypothetical protein ACHAQE_001544 [Botrytis cinerea]
MKYGILSLFLAAIANGSNIIQRQTILGTSTVNLNNNTGSTSHLASGILYGIPDTQGQIPTSFYSDMGFNYGRAGGAQVPSPGRGWIWGLSEYKVRFASALSNYKSTRAHGGKFIFLIHDLWGADGTQNSSAAYPGDNGNWASWDAYLTQLISDINANGATAGLSIDIWNEPDLTTFWNRSQAQYFQLWGRTYYRLRAAFPGVLLIGPAYAGSPSLSNTWWTGFASFVKTNNSIPDQWVWHMEGGGSANMGTAYSGLQQILTTYGLPQKTVNIDEYGTYAEQVPSGTAWWISQLERYNAIGLRGNWLSGWSLHDFMAGLLGKPNAGTSAYSPTATGYWPNGEWQVYKYYNLNMTGHRVGTSASADGQLDTYATIGSTQVKILCGVRVATGTWQITVNSLSSVGLPTSGTLNIHTWGFPNTGGPFGSVTALNDLGTVAHTYSGNSVTFPIYQVDTTTAYAFEFNVS